MVPEMAGLLPEDIERYVDEHTTAEPEHLRALAAETRDRLQAPGMPSGHVEARLLETLVYTSGARRVLEFGTYSGYSALSMAAALPEDGRLVTLEVDPEHAEVARRHFGRSRHGERIELRLGPALESLRELGDERFDLVFIDADKTGYPVYWNELVPRMRTGGVLLIDNTLRSGRVLAPENPADEAIKAFNVLAKDDPRTELVILPIADGLTMARKL